MLLSPSMTCPSPRQDFPFESLNKSHKCSTDACLSRRAPRPDFQGGAITHLNKVQRSGQPHSYDLIRPQITVLAVELGRLCRDTVSHLGTDEGRHGLHSAHSTGSVSSKLTSIVSRFHIQLQHYRRRPLGHCQRSNAAVRFTGPAANEKCARSLFSLHLPARSLLFDCAAPSIHFAGMVCKSILLFISLIVCSRKQMKRMSCRQISRHSSFAFK